MDITRITGTTKLIGLLGSPVSHSLSPLMHNEAFRLRGLDYIYLCFDVKEEELAAAVRGLHACGACGFNLTMPNKTAAVNLMDDLSPAASLIGSVNTVVCDGEFLIGHNTDGVGYMEALRDAGYDVTGKEITILGGGGAASAIIAQAALDRTKVIHVFVRQASRFRMRIEKLAASINATLSCQVIVHEQGDERALRDALNASALLVNATSVGMEPQAGETLVRDLSMLRPELVVSDVIYNPRQTRLLQDAASVGCPTFNGLYMLLYQGAAAFQLWTQESMPVEEIKEKFFSPANARA